MISEFFIVKLFINTISASKLMIVEVSLMFLILKNVLFSQITLRLIIFGLYALINPGEKYCKFEK